MKRNNILMFAVLAGLTLPAAAQQNKDSLKTGRYEDQTIDVGANRTFKLSESTASVSIITSKTTDKRSARNIGNSIIGQGLGLISLQNSGNYAAANPTFYVRGLQSLSGSSPLILVDGIERSIDNITPEEVDNVEILKDAAALSLYGYKGANGAILITTKRGKYNSKSMTVTVDHIFNFLANKPKFVNASTYAKAVNEAYANEGYGNNYRYSDNEINAFDSGQYPYSYPNVNWVDETFKNSGATNKINAQFTGGGDKFRYYAMIDLISDKGFIKSPNENDGYSTQNKYVKGNMRANLDIDLTPTTKVKVNLLGVLLESSRPGSNVDIWNMVYSIPSAAFPIKSENGNWGGSNTWAGTSNPVAQTIGAAYYKNHTRSLYSDLTLRQDLSGFLKGLSAQVCAGYDNTSNIYEDHSKTYTYDVTVPTWLADDTEPTSTITSYGSDSEMGTGAATNTFSRRFHFDLGFDYQNRFGDHSIYSQLKYDYEFQDANGYNTTIYRRNYSWFNHYGYKDRYFADLSLVYSGSSRLAPGTKWSFSPTIAAAWVLSKEKFMKNVSWVNFLKFRASFGILNLDLLPSNTWTYYVQQYSISGGTYPFTSNWGSDFGRTYLDRLATQNPTHEKAYKYNAGFDATLFDGLNVTLEGYFQRRTDIWVESSGKYTSLIGIDSPYENAGIVNSWGAELGLDYSKKLGEVTFNVGGNLNYNRNKIIEQLEEPRLYSNLEQTGNSLSQIYGLEAIGFFKDEDDIANSPTQTFSTVKPGDIKYKDVNGDGKIDVNDKTAIGYSTAAPQIYYSIHLGAEWKGFGIDAMFQGTGRYSAVLNTKSMYWPLINNTTISQYYYDNRWTTETASTAKFPRLSPESNANNYQTNTVWLADRSFLKLRNLEIYYNFSNCLLQKTKVINGAKLYVRGTDLFCLDHLAVSDPESYGATNPLTRSIVAGLAVTF